MSLATMIDLLQAQHTEITGIAAAPALADYPEVIGPSLPIALTWPEEGRWDQLATGGRWRHERTLLVQVFCMPAQSGRGIGPRLATCVGLIQAFGAAYLDPEGFVVRDDPAITIRVDAGQLTDVGVAVLNYAGVPYHGFQFTVRVYELEDSD